MKGASHEVYEVPCFPLPLLGETYETAAAFAYDAVGGVLLAVEATGVSQHEELRIGELDLVRLLCRACAGMEICTHICASPPPCAHINTRMRADLAAADYCTRHAWPVARSRYRGISDADVSVTRAL